MKKYSGLALLVLAGTLNGCATYVYQGSMSAPDSDGVQRDVLLYWTKTDPLMGEPKADMAHLRTACGALVVYENRESGVVFRGQAGRDRPVSGDQPATADGFECGRFVGKNSLRDVGAGPLELTMRCAPTSNEFSVQKLRYLKAREAPYRFQITESRQRSFFGATPDVPPPPPCRESAGGASTSPAE